MVGQQIRGQGQAWQGWSEAKPSKVVQKWLASRYVVKAKPSKVVQKWLASRYVVKAKPGKDEARPSLARLYRNVWVISCWMMSFLALMIQSVMQCKWETRSSLDVCRMHNILAWPSSWPTSWTPKEHACMELLVKLNGDVEKRKKVWILLIKKLIIYMFSLLKNIIIIFYWIFYFKTVIILKQKRRPCPQLQTTNPNRQFCFCWLNKLVF